MVPEGGHCLGHPVLAAGHTNAGNEMSQASISHWNLLVMLRPGKSVNNLITSASYPNGWSRLESPFISSLLKERVYIDFFKTVIVL